MQKTICGTFIQNVTTTYEVFLVEESGLQSPEDGVLLQRRVQVDEVLHFGQLPVVAPAGLILSVGRGARPDGRSAEGAAAVRAVSREGRRIT